MGGIYQTIGKSDDAFEIYNKALQLAQSKKEKAIILNLIAETYQRISEYEGSLNWYNKSLNLLIDYPEKEKIDTYLGIAWIHYLRGDFNVARELLGNISNNIKDLPGIELREKMARLFNQLGSIYSHSGKYEKSFEAYNKALKLFEMLEDIAGQAKVRIKQGLYEKRLAITHFNSAFELLRQAEEYINKTMINIETKFIIYFYLAQVNYYLTRTREAIEYFNRAENLVQLMISKIPEGKPRQEFLNKKVFRDYIEFKQRVKFQ